MSISGVSHSVPTHHVPKTAPAKTHDEHAESTTVKHKEADTGKEAPVKAKASHVDVKA
jgi:hypothetical protein